MLDVMKRNNHMPTYEVFLDLIQASAKDPEWYEPLFFKQVFRRIIFFVLSMLYHEYTGSCKERWSVNVECFLLIKTHGIDFVKHPPFSNVLTCT